MAIRLITGCLQQWSNVCKNKFTKEDSMRYTKITKDLCHNLWCAQTARSEIFETSMSWAGSILESCDAIFERKVSMPVSGFSVSQSAGSLV